MQQARQQALRALESSSTAAWSSTHLAVGVELQQDGQARRQLGSQERCTGAQARWMGWRGLARESLTTAVGQQRLHDLHAASTRAKSCAVAALPTACAGVTVPAASGRLRVRSTWSGEDAASAFQARRSADATVDCQVLLGIATTATAGTAQPAPTCLSRLRSHRSLMVQPAPRSSTAPMPNSACGRVLGATKTWNSMASTCTMFACRRMRCTGQAHYGTYNPSTLPHTQPSPVGAGQGGSQQELPR